jgi:hypothetical protein
MIKYWFIDLLFYWFIGSLPCLAPCSLPYNLIDAWLIDILAPCYIMMKWYETYFATGLFAQQKDSGITDGKFD